MSEVAGEAVIRIRTDESGVDFAKSGQTAGAGYSKGFTSSLKGIATAIGVTVAAKSAVDFLKGSLSEAREAQKVAAATEQIIKTTGGAAQVSASQVGDLSSALSLKAGVDDELIQSGANLLLTFKNVQNAGAGVDAIFDRTTAAAVDLSAAGFGSVTSASLQLGKALNDPIKGMAALSRSGVTFTQVQKDQVASLVAQGDLLSAQKIILEEVESQVGGVAEATATAGDRAKVAWGNMHETIGTGLLPVVDKLANVFTNDVVPGVTATVHVVGDAVDVFSDLPGPVQASAVAFLALKAASATGLLGAGGNALRSTLGATTSGVDSLRIRTMLASDAFNASRESGGRFVSTLAAVRAGATGAGAAARGFAVAAAPIALLTAGIALWSKFSEGQRQAQARVDELTQALDQQTGAMTEAARQNIITALESEGLLKEADRLGISLGLITRAAQGEKGAMAELEAQYAASKQAVTDYAAAHDTSDDANLAAVTTLTAHRNALGDLVGALGGESDAVAAAREEIERKNRADEQSVAATDGASSSLDNYADRITDAKDALRKLIDAENERREDLISDRRDQIALNQALKDAREESRKGAGGFDLDTTEGQRNLTVLLDLADQFNESSNEVRRANYEPTRNEFIRLAEKMGKTTDQAEKLADELLRVPKNAPVKFQSEGYQELISQLDNVRDRVLDMSHLGTRGSVLFGRLPALATGTKSFEGGVAMVGEQGPEIVNLPRGTQVIPARETAAILEGEGRGAQVYIAQMMPHNYGEFERQTRERIRMAALGGRRPT